jgi:hypothetical protein
MGNIEPPHRPNSAHALPMKSVPILAALALAGFSRAYGIPTPFKKTLPQSCLSIAPSAIGLHSRAPSHCSPMKRSIYREFIYGSRIFLAVMTFCVHAVSSEEKEDRIQTGRVG